MKLSTLALLLPLVLVGCASDDKSAAAADDSGADASEDGGSDGSDGDETAEEDLLQGVWLLQVPWVDSDGSGCTEGLDHNFPGAYEPGDGPWDESDTADRSDALYFVQIERLGDDEAIMLLGRDILPGTGSGDSWTFEWEEHDGTLHLEEHEDGYLYKEELDFVNTVTLALSFDGSTASGTWSGATDIERIWEESDEWVESVGRPGGEIPVGDYLVYDDGPTEGIPEANLRTESDCEGTRCTLNWVQSCAGSADVALSRTTYEDEDVYDLLEEVTQPYGSGL